ncbi:MAG: methionine synthase [Candidatus Nanopelagicales bacterium]
MDQPRADLPGPPLVRDWLPAVATGVGSMPGVDVRGTAQVVREELARDGGVPYLADLPARGPGSDLVGRALGLLTAVWPAWAVETTPTGWRLCDAPGRDSRRAQGFLSEDLDVLEEVYDGWTGPLLLPMCGPWTLAAAVELTSGERLLRDDGAIRDLLVSWGEAAAAHLGDVRRRLPHSEPAISMDEPSLSMVLAGAVPTASGAMRYRAVDGAVVRTGISAAVDRIAADHAQVLVHCCAPTANASEVPLRLLREAGVAAVGIDLALLGRDQEEQLGEAVEAGQRIGLGLAGREVPVSDVAASVDQVRDLGHRLGFAPQDLAAAVILTPPCGLADRSPEQARTELAWLRGVGRALREQDPEDSREGDPGRREARR